jgi:hypothetical protein
VVVGFPQAVAPASPGLMGTLGDDDEDEDADAVRARKVVPILISQQPAP